MPLAAPARPRKMLPPPITMQIWVPPSAASFTSAAMRSTVAVSMPKEPSPINASPETLSSTRAYFGIVGIQTPWSGSIGQEKCEAVFRPAVRPKLTRTCHLGDFVGEIAFDLLDALTNLEADETFDRNRRAKILGSLLDHLAALGL